MKLHNSLSRMTELQILAQFVIHNLTLAEIANHFYYTKIKIKIKTKTKLLPYTLAASYMHLKLYSNLYPAF